MLVLICPMKMKKIIKVNIGDKIEDISSLGVVVIENEVD